MSFTLHGIGVSGGIAIGRAHLVSHATLEVNHYVVLCVPSSTRCIVKFPKARRRSFPLSSTCTA